MAQRLKIQDGIVVYETSDSSVPLGFYINGDLFNRAFYSEYGSITQELNVGKIGFPDTGINIIGEGPTSSGYISTEDDQDLIIETGDNGDLFLTAGTGGHILFTGSVASNLVFLSPFTVTGLPLPVNGTDAVNLDFINSLSSITLSIVAAGTTQGTATALPSKINVVSTSVVAVSVGVMLPVAVAGTKIIVINSSSNAINVYPRSGSQIGILGPDNPQEILAALSGQFVAVSATQWYLISA